MLNFKKRIKFIALELHIIHFAHIQFHLFCIYLFIYLLFVFLGEQISSTNGEVLQEVGFQGGVHQDLEEHPAPDPRQVPHR